MTEHNIGPGAVEKSAGVPQNTEDVDEPTPRPAGDPPSGDGETDERAAEDE